MESELFDPYYIAEVLADLLGRQRGCEMKIALIPKHPPVESSADGTGG